MERFKQRARKFRAGQTSAEGRLWRALRNRNLARWKFRRQHPIDRYVVDFVTLDGKLIVEVDGVTHDSVRETRRDAFGWSVSPISTCAKTCQGVLEMIYRELCND